MFCALILAFNNFQISNFKMKIRPATAADLPSIVALESRAATAAHWNSQAYEHLFSVDSPRLVLVADDAGVQGFVIARQIRPEWELENIAVAADAQRRGVAAALLEHLLDLVRQQGGEVIFLEVRESNAAARSLYASCGFAETGRRRLYYKDPNEDAVLYQNIVRT
jgi:ribosomal-protein-alanine N-acetyltransferase